MTATQSASTSTTRRIRWLLALPKLGIVLLLVALVSLLWLLHRNEIEEDRAALTRRPHFLSASSLFAACCLSAFSSSFCCDVSF